MGVRRSLPMSKPGILGEGGDDVLSIDLRRGAAVSVVLALLTGLLPAPVAASEGRPPGTRTISVPTTLAGAVRLGSGPGRAHLGFAASHIAFSWSGDEGTSIAYKLVRPGHLVGRWIQAPESGDLHDEERHHSAVISVPRSAVIRYKPVAPRNKSVSDIKLDYLNTLDGPRELRTVPIVTARDSTAETPNIVTRAEWGADESLKRKSGSCKRAFYPVQQLFVHHTAGSNNDPNPAATMRAIYHYHAVSRGWCDIGYNFVIGRDGTIFEGRWARKYAPWETHTGEDLDGRAVAGAHVAGYNSGSVGISLMGNFQTSKVPAKMRSSLVDLLAWESDRHDLSPQSKHTYRNPDTGTTKSLPYVAGHRNAGSTSCPGRKLYKILPDVRSDVAFKIGSGRASSRLTLTTPVKKITYGADADLSGFLTLKDGTALPGQTVILHRKRGRGSPWGIEAQPLTGLDGSYSHGLTPERNTRLRSEFRDTPEAWGSQSHDLRIKVRHSVTLEAEGGSPDPAGTIVYPPGTTSVTFSGTGAPVHKDRTVKVHVFKVNQDGSSKKISKTPVALAADGTYTYPFPVPSGSGARTFTAVAWYSGDKGHLAGKSGSVRFVIPS